MSTALPPTPAPQEQARRSTVPGPQPPLLAPSQVPPSPPKRPRLKKWQWALIGIGAVLLLGIIAAIANGGSQSTPTNPASTTAPSQATTKPVAPTATSVPKQWVTVQHFTGSQNSQTATFHVADGNRIVWTATPTNTTANIFSIEMYTSDGSYAALIANTGNLTKVDTSTYTVHGNSDVYLKISTLYVRYDISVQAYQ